MLAEQRNVVVRYSAPTKLCSFPYGQIWKQMHDNDEYSLFIQTSTKEEEPMWLRMSDFLERAFIKQLTDESFISDCLVLFHN